MSLRRALGRMLCFLAVGVAALRAHDPGISSMQGELRADAIVLVTGFAPGDVQQLLPPEMRHEGAWSQAEFDAARAALVAIAPEIWEVRVGGDVLRPREARAELLAGDNVSLTLVYPRGDVGAKLSLRAMKLGDLPSGHRQFVIVADEKGSVIWKKLLRAEDPVVGDSPTWWEFILLGVEHIWTGYDHLLFLFALLVVCGSFRSIVAIVSCFTLAHSITLALAALNVVNLPARLVEPAIAASIVYVGVENLVRRGAEPRGRWALTFGFGLIHGFGFASVLRDLGVGGAGGQGIALPLVTFNLGVELGQIAIAAVVLPVVWQLRKREGFRRRGVPALSAVVALAGLWWFVERTVLAR